MDRAVEAATEAFYRGEWSQMGGYDRSVLLNRLANLIEENREELAQLEGSFTPLICRTSVDVRKTQ